jgi:hypothetical protein
MWVLTPPNLTAHILNMAIGSHLPPNLTKFFQFDDPQSYMKLSEILGPYISLDIYSE